MSVSFIPSNISFRKDIKRTSNMAVQSIFKKETKKTKVDNDVARTFFYELKKWDTNYLGFSVLFIGVRPEVAVYKFSKWKMRKEGRKSLSPL